MLAGVLRTLVGIDDLRFPVAGYGSPKKLRLGLFLQAVGYLPADDEATVHVNDRRQIHEAASHRNVGDVDRPHLVGTRDFQSPKQVWMDVP